MALTAIAVYAPSEQLFAIIAVAALFSLVNFPSIVVWTCLGQSVRRFLNQPPTIAGFQLGDGRSARRIARPDLSAPQVSKFHRDQSVASTVG